jgi:hypothetical protein
VLCRRLLRTGLEDFDLFCPSFFCCFTAPISRIARNVTLLSFAMSVMSVASEITICPAHAHTGLISHHQPRSVSIAATIASDSVEADALRIRIPNVVRANSSGALTLERHCFFKK